MTTVSADRQPVRYAWKAKERAFPGLRMRVCRPINVPVTRSVFERLTAASFRLPINFSGGEFALVRDLGLGVDDGQRHSLFVLVWHGSLKALRPSRLVVCRDDTELIETEADERLANLHVSRLVEQAHDIASAMLAFVSPGDTGHQSLAAQAALRRSADQTIRRYRRRGRSATAISPEDMT
jgi:hypothetical protein